jgi:hypothetical protein
VLYIFAGTPVSGIHAGGLQYCIEEQENLGEIEQDTNIQYRKTGVFTPGKTGEWLRNVEYRMSAGCTKIGVAWDFFPDHFDFGNGITMQRTHNAEESRWVKGHYPDADHIVNFVFVITTHRLPEFAYQRVAALIEGGAEPLNPIAYIREDDPGKYISTPHPYRRAWRLK